MPIFDSHSLESAVAKQLADAGVPDDHHNAFAIVATTSGTVKGVLSTKINDVWQVDSVFTVAKGQHVEGGVQVKATW